MSSEQELFWRGQFGDEYTSRCTGDKLVENNVHFFEEAFSATEICFHLTVSDLSFDIIEFGANRGLNIQALIRMGAVTSKIRAVEINASACDHLRKIDGLSVFERSMFEDKDLGQHSLVISKGLLIHIGPYQLEDAYDVLYCSCKNDGYILIAEYFAPSETEVIYRGYGNKLWRRPYGDEMLKRYGHNLRLVDYGFVGKIDPVAPQDDLNWWLFEKRNGRVFSSL